MSFEYRREQALSAISAADERFRARDFPAAWMFALRARGFFPFLLGLHSAIAAYDVLRRSAAAAPKLPPGKSGDWWDVLDVAGESPDHDAVEARYEQLRTLLTDPARTEFAAAEALKIVEQAWRKFKASRSPKSHPATAQGRPSPSEDFSGKQVDSFTPKSQTQEEKKKKKSKMQKQPLTGSTSSRKQLTTRTAATDIGKKLVLFRRPSKPSTVSALCPRCDDWLRLVVVGKRIYLSCIGCGRCYAPRCGRCRELHKPKHVSGQHVLLGCGDDCSSPVVVRRVTRPSSRRTTATLAGGAPSHVLQSSIYGRSISRDVNS